MKINKEITGEGEEAFLETVASINAENKAAFDRDQDNKEAQHNSGEAGKKEEDRVAYTREEFVPVSPEDYMDARIDDLVESYKNGIRERRMRIIASQDGPSIRRFAIVSELPQEQKDQLADQLDGMVQPQQ